ncbi:MAG TPA: lytic transglycosylase domain-containing protein [Limnochordales bacterium]
MRVGRGLTHRRLSVGWAVTLAVLAVALVAGVANLRTVVSWLYPIYYRELLLQWAGRRGLDPWLVVAVVRVESNFSTTALSPRGAVGLMQLLPDTARWIAEQTGEGEFFADLLFVPEVNVRLGTWYLAHLLEIFQGREAAALAAYNAGRGRVERWLEEGGWDGSADSLRAVPYGETRRFVERVLRMRELYRWLYAR